MWCVGPGRCCLGDLYSQPPVLENKSQMSLSTCSYTGEVSPPCSSYLFPYPLRLNLGETDSEVGLCQNEIRGSLFCDVLEEGAANSTKLFKLGVYILMINKQK